MAARTRAPRVVSAAAIVVPAVVALVLALTPRDGGRSGPAARGASFVGPSFYARWLNGPSPSADVFPVLAYQTPLRKWRRLPARVKAAGFTGVYMGFDEGDPVDFKLAAEHGLSMIVGAAGRRIDRVGADARAVTAMAMQDEPDADGTRYAPANGTPEDDVGAQRYVADARAQRAADPTRPLIGNFTKDVTAWAWPPAGWSRAQFERHLHTMLGALDITSADVYGWTDPWEWTQGAGTGTGYVGAWVYGQTIARLRALNPAAPAYGFVECCADPGSPPKNTMTPGMIRAAVWNLLVHGARGLTYWPRDFYHADDRPYGGARFTGEFSLFADHQWDAQYAAIAAVNAQIKTYARQLNARTVTAVGAAGQGGVPVSVLGKDDGGKLWLLVQADGDRGHPLSNTAPMRAVIDLPRSIRPGTTFDVAGEHRTATVTAAHQIRDTFGPVTETPAYSGAPLTFGYQQHIYRQR